jgi:hypothetical protein
MQEEIIFENLFFNGTNLFLCFVFIVTSFFLYGWKRSSIFNLVNQKNDITNAVRAFVLSLAGCGVFLTFYKVFESIEASKNGKANLSILLLQISLSLMVLLLSLVTFLVITPGKKNP